MINVVTVTYYRIRIDDIPISYFIQRFTEEMQLLSRGCIGNRTSQLIDYQGI